MVVQLVDDLSEGEIGYGAGGTVKFAIDQVGYEIDLSGQHGEQLRAALQRRRRPHLRWLAVATDLVDAVFRAAAYPATGQEMAQTLRAAGSTAFALCAHDHRKLGVAALDLLPGRRDLADELVFSHVRALQCCAY